ncbi:MAG: GGDEF domain-containing protein [Deltaproteobacteria bacterium]|jgi:diguanylate cyclase (GGDEF)-like protein|nr:GGDEF domain-containing protein [Deltaproteobacteria bacterium]
MDNSDDPRPGSLDKDPDRAELQLRLRECQSLLRASGLKKLDFLGSLRHLMTAVGSILSRGWTAGDMDEVVRAFIVRLGEEEITPAFLDEFADKISGHLEVSGIPGRAGETGSGAFSEEGFMRFLEEAASLKGSRYVEDATNLERMVKGNVSVHVFMPLLSSLLLRIVGDQRHERQELSSKLSAIIRSLLNVERQFRDFLDKSMGFIGDDNQGFSRNLTIHLEQIQDAVAVSSPEEHERLLNIISEEVGLISDTIRQKSEDDDKFLSVLSTERSNLKSNLADVTRDYSNFVRHSNQLLNELKVIKAVALRDALTGVYNRRAYDEQLFVTLINYKAGKLSNFGMILFDIDFFRDVNNKHGHQAGDAILVGLTKLLIGTLRSDDFIFRYGGDEFVVLLPNADLEAGSKVAEKLRAAVERHRFPLSKNSTETIPVTISVGVAEAKQGDTSETIFSRADQALYVSKQGGRNRVSAATKAGAKTLTKPAGKQAAKHAAKPATKPLPPN